MAPSRVLVVSHPGGRAHEPPPGHPESKARIDAVDRGVAAVAGIERVLTRPATARELERVHDPAHVAAVRTLSQSHGGQIDGDTFVSPGSWDAACGAAGAGLVAVEQLLRDPGLIGAFAATRPPGHHAGVSAASGFCIFNNVAVAAGHLLDRGARVAIVDWDAHHGNGTQSIFWDEERVLYVSIHQESLYPGTGFPHERGPSPDRLTTVNLPLPAGATGDHYLTLFDQIAERMISDFGPDWILVSCGFDAHRDDPLAGMALDAGDFALLTDRVMSCAPDHGRIVLCLEGGYDLTALEACTASVLSVLAGDAARTGSPTIGGPGAARVAELVRFWA